MIVLLLLNHQQFLWYCPLFVSAPFLLTAFLFEEVWNLTANCWWTAKAVKSLSSQLNLFRTNRNLKKWNGTLVMVPTAFVRPSLNTSLWSQCRYSGVLMKRKWTVALSPVRKQSLFMDRIVAVCLILPQCTKNVEISD